MTATADNSQAGEAGSRSFIATTLRNKFQQLLAFAGLIVIFVFFSVASEYFLTFSNIVSVLLSTVVIGTLAVGTTFVIISGGIDLSLGTGMSLCAVMCGMFITSWGLPLPIGIVLTLAVGALIGFVNGFNITVLGIPPFIATLAMMMAAKGLALVISGSSPIYFSDTPAFHELSNGTLIPGVGIPNAVLIWLAVACIAAFVLNKRVFGRYVFAIGSNEEAIRRAGINTRRWKIAIYSVGGLFIGLAGILISARLSSAHPSLGMGYELRAIAAVVIGGTSLFGGVGSIVGTVIGALIMSVIHNGLQVMSVPQEWQTVVLGVVILAAVYLDNIRRKAV